MVTDHYEGKTPLHRDEIWKKREREEEKEKQKNVWYKEGGKYEAPLFVLWTENSDFKEECQKIVDGLGLKIKVIEKTGPKVKLLLHKSSIGMNKGCPSGCIICSDGKNKVSCLTSDVTYRIKCPVCKEIHIVTA